MIATDRLEQKVLAEPNDGQICHGTLTTAISELLQQQMQVDTRDTQVQCSTTVIYHQRNAI
jgi:hypothetical protein